MKTITAIVVAIMLSATAARAAEPTALEFASVLIAYRASCKAYPPLSQATIIKLNVLMTASGVSLREEGFKTLAALKATTIAEANKRDLPAFCGKIADAFAR